METVKEFVFNGYKATVIIPENPNGKWVWKTEFFYAFDQAEKHLLDLGYTRVYYNISDKYGSYKAVRLMRTFHKYIIKELNLCEKTILFGFSRGGLYAFNYALFYPESVEKVYLDAPVLDVKTWPWAHSVEQAELFKEYSLNQDTLPFFDGNPVDNLKEYFSYGIPTLLIAGGADEVVPFEYNAKKMIKYCTANGIALNSVVKPECKHHPHSLDDVSPIIKFVEEF